MLTFASLAWHSRPCVPSQVAAAEAFGAIARDRVLSPSELQACVLPFVTRNLNKERSEEVRLPMFLSSAHLFLACSKRACDLAAPRCAFHVHRLPSPAWLQETEAWLQTLGELIPALDKEVLKTEVLSLALSKGDVEGNVGSKVLCAKILGSLAARLVSRLRSGTRILMLIVVHIYS